MAGVLGDVDAFTHETLGECDITVFEHLGWVSFWGLASMLNIFAAVFVSSIHQ
jgi:hypothetical protein